MGPQFNLPQFVISARQSGALKMSISITCLYKTVLKMNYLFRVCPRLFILKILQPPLPLPPEIEW